MALSLLSHQSSFIDLQTIFDPLPLQQHHNLQPLQHQHHQQQATQTETSRIKKVDLLNFNDEYTDQMEYNNQNHYQQHQSSNISPNNNSSNSNNNTSINNNNRNNSNSSNINQTLTNTNRSFMSGYSHQHIGSDYVINFVDSPPNSEESWTDEHSKGSPRPQIIDVQTIYSNSGSRKRRMDWDSLDIGQSGNTASSAQTGEILSKIPLQEKDKQKREKSTGRGSWTDDIGFDLNAEFNSSSYLNNEPFLSFSPALTVLKQEPQTDQLKTNNKNSLDPPNPTGIVTKIDKSVVHGGETTASSANHPNQDKAKNGLSNTICGCGSPKVVPQQDQENIAVNAEKTSNSATGHGNAVAAFNNVDQCDSSNGAALHQLTVVDTSKIESSPNAAGSQHSDDHKFQYILAAATSIATKNNEETLTYLNQGQSYEIKLKKIGDLSFYRDKILKSVIKICFHERRLQFMEREQMQQWQASRPGERIVEVDVPLSYGLCHVSQPLNPNYLNTVEIFWDPLKEVGVYIKVNCISTEFTPKKHGGEKGVPFRLQIETYIESANNTSGAAAAAAATATAQTTSNSASQSPIGIAGSPGSPPGNLTPNGNSLNAVPLAAGNGKQPVHAAACQIKVFKLKGADRKHKQDREKIQKRPQSEQEKFQPSYECTIMNDIPPDLVTLTNGCFSPEYMKIWPNSPVHMPKYDGILPYANASPNRNSSPIAINSVTSTNSPTLKLMDVNMVSPQQVTTDMDDYIINIMPDSTPTQVAQWLTTHRLTSYLATFAHFSGSDIMRMSKDDLIQICGLADGIRMFNILRAKAIAPRLTVYVSMDGSSYNAVYLLSNTSKELTHKLFKLPGIYELIANGGINGILENSSGGVFNNWSGMQSKYSGSGSNIFNDVNKSFIYISGPSGVHVTVTDEVLNNEIKDGSLFALEVQNGKVVMKPINKNDN